MTWLTELSPECASPLGLMSPVIVKMFERFVRRSMVLVPFEPCLPHTSTFLPDAAIGGEMVRS